MRGLIPKKCETKLRLSKRFNHQKKAEKRPGHGIRIESSQKQMAKMTRRTVHPTTVVPLTFKGGRAQGDDLRTLLGGFVSSLPQFVCPKEWRI